MVVSFRFGFWVGGLVGAFLVWGFGGVVVFGVGLGFGLGCWFFVFGEVVGSGLGVGFAVT